MLAHIILGLLVQLHLSIFIAKIPTLEQVGHKCCDYIHTGVVYPTSSLYPYNTYFHIMINSYNENEGNLAGFVTQSNRTYNNPVFVFLSIIL